jgi:hypothetical protein
MIAAEKKAPLSAWVVHSFSEFMARTSNPALRAKAKHDAPERIQAIVPCGAKLTSIGRQDLRLGRK